MSAARSVRVLAAITWMRLLRGRALWVSVLVAILPCLYSLMMRGPLHGAIADELFVFEILVLGILAPMFVATSLGDEIEDRTTTYLWSRPIPRWSVLAGKLATIIPVVVVAGCASWFLSSQLAWSRTPPALTFVAIALGAIALAFLATMFSTLAPKHGMALTICYLLFFDLPIGVLPAALQEVSVTHQVRTVSGLYPTDGAVLEGLVGLAVLALVAASISAWRIRRLEA